MAHVELAMQVVCTHHPLPISLGSQVPPNMTYPPLIVRRKHPDVVLVVVAVVVVQVRVVGAQLVMEEVHALWTSEIVPFIHTHIDIDTIP